ncbi:MAG: hypothetical protein KAU27_01025 [Desulfuromonadales bacterium]|nr:hypothetical protein [Desulfuromonadales bacterium]
MKVRLLSTMIILIVASGTALIPLMGDTTGLEPFKVLFLAFVTAIIAIQLVPAMILIGCVLKSVVLSDEKRQEN